MKFFFYKFATIFLGLLFLVSTLQAQVKNRNGKLPAGKRITPDISASKTLRKNLIGMDLIYIPAGNFLMGLSESDLEKSMNIARQDLTAPTSGLFTNAFPQHKVAFEDGFWIGKYEVTQAQWKNIMGTTVQQQ